MINLDDLDAIKKIDKEDALSVALMQYRQLDYEFNPEFKSGQNSFSNVVLGGMGGSALYAEVIRVWPGLKVPFEICRDYNIPTYVGEKTLFIASSFSGNTEETLNMLEQAESVGATIFIITAGGRLLDIANEKGYPLCVLDSSIPQPRMSTLNALKSLTTLLIGAGVMDEGALSELLGVKDFIKQESQEWVASTDRENNLAKQIAAKIQGNSAVVYSGNKLRPAANKLKIAINENAKNVAWLNTYPEYNHNEFMGWSSSPEEKSYTIVNILDDIDHPRIQRRFEVSDELLKGRRPEPINIEVKGDSLLQKIAWGLVLGDFISIYLGILNGVDPTPVSLVEDLKIKL